MKKKFFMALIFSAVTLVSSVSFAGGCNGDYCYYNGSNYSDNR